MKVNGVHHRSLWPVGTEAIGYIDQTKLPHAFATREARTAADVIDAIRTMQVRGAPLIGVAGAYGLALAMRADATDAHLTASHAALAAARPTAVNLRWALDRVLARLRVVPGAERAAVAWAEAGAIADEDVEINRALGAHGARLIAATAERRRAAGAPRVNVLTHCNAGWIATVDYGTALSAIYQAFDHGVPLHVWVDETRPRSQGLLTAWELAAHGVPYTLIVDNAAGHLMQRGHVDLVLVGADRVTAAGDVCNKIGTYEKAVVAHENRVPFYAAVPSPTIDWSIADALVEIPIEERDGDEVRVVNGRDGRAVLADASVPVANPAFDVTPARFVTGIVTERGVAAPARLAELFERRHVA